jgi:multidrug efflux pump subunit AcrA (membrane-fusion protein)
MPYTIVSDLRGCSDFAQTQQARPPAVVHGTTLLLTALVGAALAWLALTKANLVVRAPGRVRPVSVPVQVFSAANGESLSASVGGRVVEVNFREGGAVRMGDVLLRLDTGRLDQDIRKHRQAIRAGEEELARLTQACALLERQHQVAHAKATAELDNATEEVRREKERRTVERRAAEAELKAVAYEEQQLRRLVEQRAAASVELVRAVARRKEAEEKQRRASVPVEEGRLDVLRRAVELTDRDYAVRREEAVLKRDARQAQLATERVELAKLEMERQQAVLQAPLDGVVTRGEVKVGDVLERGKAVLDIAEERGFVFEAEVSSEDVGLLRVGLPVNLKLDAFEFQKYGTLAGRVVFISPDSAVRGPQRPPTYRVRIETAGDEVGSGEHRGRLKLGMTGQADIVTGEESLLKILVRRIRQVISLG